MLRAAGWVAIAGLLTAGACGTSEPAPTPTPMPTGELKSALDLAPLLPANADVVGVTVSPEGKTYVLDRVSGLYVLEGSRATLVFAAPTSIELTDVVALGGERFAVPAENDGFMIDVHNQTFSSYFCYLPSIDPGTVDPGGPPSVSQSLRIAGVEVAERTESIAFNHDTLQLFAQPRTTRMDTGEVVGSELFIFSDGGGQPIAVQPMPSVSFVAGGMVAAGGSRLLMGQGSVIYEMAGEGVAPSPRKLLADKTIDISGLALDADGDLLVLDRTNRRLLEMSW
jgi:hypothetical protein